MASPARSGDRGDVAGESTLVVSEVEGILRMVRVEDGDDRIRAAREIRRLTKTSSVNRRLLAAAVEPLVSMLTSGSEEFAEAALLALLNLAVKDERNKINIVKAGALGSIIAQLESASSSLREYATATLLTLTASSFTKPAVGAAGAIPLLIAVLKDGDVQAQIDAVTALYNLSTLSENLTAIMSAKPVHSLLNLLRSSKKSSKTAEKCMALLEKLVGSEDGRTALTLYEQGVLAVVEILEEGSLLSKEYAVGILLTMCKSNREKYRETILKEGAIPGLLELTVKGTPKSQCKAHLLLQLLRDSPYSRPGLRPDAIDNIVTSIVSHVDRDDRTGKAKKMLDEMVQVSMEQSLRHLQQRASLHSK